MVNNKPHRRLSDHECIIEKTPDKNGVDRNIITNGPVYYLIDSQNIIRAHGFRVLTEKAGYDQARYFPVEKDLLHFINSLVVTDRRKSERCKTMHNREVNCDSYRMPWNFQTKARCKNGTRIYIKFGFFFRNPTGLIISIHPPIQT